MATGDVSSLDVSFAISELADSSHLKTLLQADVAPAFKFAAASFHHWDTPVEKFPAGLKLDFNLTQGASWATSTGITFGLSGTAGCSLEIIASGSVIDYVDGIGSTTNAAMPAGDYSGSVYVKMSLSFNIAGNVSGGGNVGALGIRGNAKATKGTSFVFAHKVKSSTLLRDAVTESLNHFIFPFQPNCALRMSAGDLAQVTFSGRLSYGLALTYGLASYNFTAPSVSTALESATKGKLSLTMPGVSVDIGANFNLGVVHSDDFTAIVEKLDANDAFLYLMRARKKDVSAGASFGAQVFVTGLPSVNVNQQGLQAGVNLVTNGLAGTQAASVSAVLENRLSDKVNNWINNYVQSGTGLSATWDSQKNTMLISKYKVALDDPAVLDHSWDFFCQGNIRSAVGAGGLMLLPGSGVSQDINRSLTLSCTFFNFFHARNVASYFEQSRVYVTDTGDLRFLFDIGEERDTEVNKALKKARIHFVADATANSAADVKLQVELSETHDKGEAARMAAIAAYIPQGTQASVAAADMQKFAAANPKGTLNLNFELESSAYGALSCSPYDGKKPPANQSVDARNWQVFHDAAVSLLNPTFAARLTYATWQAFNQQSTGAKVADRRHEGNPVAGITVWEASPSDVQQKLMYFCLASADFMNLCDDLHQLAQTLSTIKIPDDWNRLLCDLKDIVMRDVNTDFAKPAVAALLKLCPAKTVEYEKEVVGDAFTCTVRLR